MKKLVGLVCLTWAFCAFAGSQTKTFVYDGSVSSAQMLFQGEKTHTEYRTEQVPATCTRQEFDGWRTRCFEPQSLTQVHDPIPRPGPGYPGGYPIPRTCIQEPVYRTVFYNCTQTVSTPFEVKDYDVEAKVSVSVKTASTLAANEALKVTLNGDELSVGVKSSRKFFVILKSKDINAVMNGSVKFLDAAFEIELIEAAPIVRTLFMTNIQLYNETLSFTLGQTVEKKYLDFSLNVVKKKIGSDRVLFDRDLSASEVSLDGKIGHIKLKDINLQLADGKFALTVTAFFKPEGTLLNRGDFEATEAGRTLIYSVR